jgi:hypothetical protein
MGSANQAISLGKNHLTDMPMENAFIHPITGKEIEYTALMKHPTLEPFWKRGFVNDELGRHFQGIRDIQRTNTCFFVELTNIPKDRQITYVKFA